jgi:hypothetical protein
MRGFRAFYWFIIGFALSLLLVLGSGCAPKQKLDLGMQSGIIKVSMEEVTKEPAKSGWAAADEEGYAWVYQDGDGLMVASCSYTYTKFKGQEQWLGVFYYQETDYMYGEYPTAILNSLCECVVWSEHFIYGGYYL